MNIVHLKDPVIHSIINTSELTSVKTRKTTNAESSPLTLEHELRTIDFYMDSYAKNTNAPDLNPQLVESRTAVSIFPYARVNLILDRCLPH